MFKFFKTFYFRFLEVGHTQCPGDSMHACIENYAKKRNVYTQSQWAEIMKDCTVEKKYKVLEREQESILNYEGLAENFKWDSVGVSKIRELKIIPKTTNVYVKYDLSHDSEAIPILKKNVSISQIKKFQLFRAYNSLIALNLKKKQDFKKMLDKQLIPQIHHQVYNNLLSII